MGGTSFEVALSKYCSPECIITPISAEDELSRAALGFMKPQNFTAARRLGLADSNSINYQLTGDFANHSPLKVLNDHLPEPIYRTYHKLSIHRDSADMLVSQYWFRMRGLSPAMRMSFGDWYHKNKRNILENYAIAPPKGRIRCDTVLKYEQLEGDIQRCEFLPPDFWATFSKLRLKGQYRDPSSIDTLAFYRQAGVDPDELNDLVVSHL